MRQANLRKTLLLILGSCTYFFVHAATCKTFVSDNTAIQLYNVYNRAKVSLDGQWKILMDPMENGYYNHRYEVKSDGYFMNQKANNKSDLVEYDFDTADYLQVPGDWNSQKQELLWYEGTIWYKRNFRYTKKQDKRAFLHFGAVNYDAKIYLNGQKLGEHQGGFTPFSFEITNKVQEGTNYVVVKVNNTRHRDAIPTVNIDWWNYGGITRSVDIVEVPQTFIHDYFIQLGKGQTRQVEGYVKLSNAVAGQQITLSIPELNFTKTLKTDVAGYAKLSFPLKPILWSPENPKLYEVKISSANDSITDMIGFRTIETRGQDILLNGKPIFLRGVCIHEEAAYRGGRACSLEDARQLLGWSKELGCNFVRLAHYTHNEHMVREAERMGILLWAEIPLYWTIQFENPAVLSNAKKQFLEMYNRDKNRAGVIIWALANETPVGEARLNFLKNYGEYIRSLDNTRLISAAMDTHGGGEEPNTIVMNDELGEILDVLGCNEYYGWYNGLPAESSKLKWVSTFSKPLIVSEFGAGAVYGKHGDKLERWTEEYQAYCFEENLKMLEKIPFLRGTAPWILMDFRSARRPLTGIQDYYNRKGIISDRGQKKQAFYTIQKYYRNK